MLTGDYCARKIKEDSHWFENHRNLFQRSKPLLVDTIRYMDKYKLEEVSTIEKAFHFLGSLINKREVWRFVVLLFDNLPPLDFNPFEVTFELNDEDKLFALSVNVGFIRYLNDVNFISEDYFQCMRDLEFLRTGVLSAQALQIPHFQKLLKSMNAYRVLPTVFSDEEYEKLFFSDFVYDYGSVNCLKNQIKTREDLLQYCSEELKEKLQDFVERPWLYGYAYATSYSDSIFELCKRYNVSNTKNIQNAFEVCSEEETFFLIYDAVKFVFRYQKIPSLDDLLQKYLQQSIVEAEDTVMEFIDNFHNLYHEDFCIQGEIECKESSVIAGSLSLGLDYENVYCIFPKHLWYLGVLCDHYLSWVQQYASKNSIHFPTLDLSVISKALLVRPFHFNRCKFYTLKEFREYYYSWLSSQTVLPRVRACMNARRVHAF